MDEKTPRLYPVLREWDRAMGSFPYWIGDNQRLAREQNAPLDACYRKTDGTFALLRDCGTDTIARYRERVRQIHGPTALAAVDAAMSGEEIARG